jgi:NAD(P)-dependent dehydrogenase (short-subunit alcohol dehydrogenase family)
MRSQRIASATDVAGRTYVVTGANSGIGFEAARGLVARCAHVVRAVRDTAKRRRAAARLSGPGSTSVVELDLSDLDLVAECATTLPDRHDNLSALICNAGVMGGPYGELMRDAHAGQPAADNRHTLVRSSVTAPPRPWSGASKRASH